MDEVFSAWLFKNSLEEFVVLIVSPPQSTPDTSRQEPDNFPVPNDLSTYRMPCMACEVELCLLHLQFLQ